MKSPCASALPSEPPMAAIAVVSDARSALMADCDAPDERSLLSWFCALPASSYTGKVAPENHAGVAEPISAADPHVTSADWFLSTTSAWLRLLTSVRL